MTDDNGNPFVKVDYKDKCKCEGKEPTYMVNYSMMWHEGDIMCRTCNKFVRMWDAG